MKSILKNQFEKAFDELVTGAADTVGFIVNGKYVVVLSSSEKVYNMHWFKYDSVYAPYITTMMNKRKATYHKEYCGHTELYESFSDTVSEWILVYESEQYIQDKLKEYLGINAKVIVSAEHENEQSFNVVSSPSYIESDSIGVSATLEIDVPSYDTLEDVEYMMELFSGGLDKFAKLLYDTDICEKYGLDTLIPHMPVTVNNKEYMIFKGISKYIHIYDKNNDEIITLDDSHVDTVTKIFNKLSLYSSVNQK